MNASAKLANARLRIRFLHRRSDRKQTGLVVSSQFTFARRDRPNARGQSQSAVSRHRSERAHPRLPWHSQCPLAGTGGGTECCAWLDAPRFAAKPQVQGRLASGEEFGPFGEYAPAALTIKPDLFDRTMTVRAAPDRSWATAREEFRRQIDRSSSIMHPSKSSHASTSPQGGESSNQQARKPNPHQRFSQARGKAHPLVMSTGVVAGTFATCRNISCKSAGKPA